MSSTLHQPHWPKVAARCCLLSLNSAQAETWTITDAAHPLNVPPGVRFIRLDDQFGLEAQLLAHFSPTLREPACLIAALRKRPLWDAYAVANRMRRKGLRQSSQKFAQGQVAIRARDADG